MKSVSTSLFTAIFAATLATITVPVIAGQPAGANATPFGLEIGTATCDAARTKLGRVNEKKLDGSDVLLEAQNPSALYEGATKLVARCSENRVIAVQFEASKGGMGNGASREVYSDLSRKYKLVAGGAMPQLGDGYARFASGNSIVEQSAPHMSFEFKVTYYEKGFYDGIVASNKVQDKKSRGNKQSSL